MRTIDVARAIGISPQRIRDYETEGILHQIPRTKNGYRAYNQRHIHLIAAYRSLTLAGGRSIAKHVIDALHQHDIETVLTSINKIHSNLNDERHRVAKLHDATIVLIKHHHLIEPTDTMSIGQLAEALGIRPSTLRVWEDAHLIRPERDVTTGHRRYHDHHAHHARIVQLLRNNGHSFVAISDILTEITEHNELNKLKSALEQRQARINIQTRAAITAAAFLNELCPKS